MHIFGVIFFFQMTADKGGAVVVLDRNLYVK